VIIQGELLMLKETNYLSLSKKYNTPNSLQNKKLDLVISKIRGFDLLLDVGCGTGEFISRLCSKNPNAIIYGLEINNNAYDLCVKRFRNRENVIIYNIDVGNISNKIERGIDCITMLDVLEHNDLSNIRNILKILYTLLNANGELLITTPGILDKFIIEYKNIINVTYPHITGLTSYGWVNEVKRAGFTLIENRTVKFPVFDFAFLNRYCHLFGQCHMIHAKK
jgi:cyclopropane fatty-acyl-phospholipid synthase-like methyltransferase